MLCFSTTLPIGGSLLEILSGRRNSRIICKSLMYFTMFLDMFPCWPMPYLPIIWWLMAKAGCVRLALARLTIWRDYIGIQWNLV